MKSARLSGKTASSTALLALAVVALTGCAKLPQDDTGAKTVRYESVMGQRYTEFFLIGGNAITKNLKAGVYNTMGLNNPTGAGDSCPQAILDKVDAAELKKHFNVLGAFKNGPRLWTLDWIDVVIGQERDFNGLKARWVTWLDLKGIDLSKQGSAAYKVVTVQRKTQFGINQGSRAYILDDPEGNAWVMKSAGLIVDPNQKFEDLKDLGNRLKPAPGWKFRSVALEADLVLTPDPNGIAHITQDELGNTYDRAGGPYSNFKP
jgi:hypothetical protein